MEVGDCGGADAYGSSREALAMSATAAGRGTFAFFSSRFRMPAPSALV
jgi:hypothetical protein